MMRSFVRAVHDNVAFRTDSVAFLERIARQRGDAAWFRLGTQRAVLFSHPEAIREILVEKASAFGKGNLIQRARRLLGDGLLTSGGDLHKRQRRRIQPAFSQAQVSRYASAVPGLTMQHASGYASRNGAVDLGADMDALSMSIVAKTLLGADIVERVPALGEALHTLARWAPLLMISGSHRLERILPVGDALRLLENTIDELVRADSAGSPLLHALMHSHGTDVPMSARQVRDEVMTIFLAGHDTTAAALTWTFILLAEHPDIRSEVQREVREVSGDGIPAAEQVQSMKYLDVVIREVLRLYPPISRIGRRPFEDMVIGDVPVLSGTPVFVSPFVTQRDARWFEYADQFLPERWINAPALPRFSYFPFGAGPRSCIGEHFARRSIILATATLVNTWELTPDFDGVPRPRSLLTLKPRGLVSMVCTARTRSPRPRG